MFIDRAEAGRKLADALEKMELAEPVVLALPRGGVPVAAPIAERLGAPLDLVLVRKIGVPGHEELAAGAVAEGAEPVFNASVLASIGRRPEDFADAVAKKRAEIAERRKMYLGGREQVSLKGRTVIVVDDGIATGATVKAALGGVRESGAGRVILAVPVASAEALAEIEPMVDDTICLEMPSPFYAVGAHYRKFLQVDDDEVVAFLGGSAGD